LYRLRKFGRRNRTVVCLTLLVVATALAVLVNHTLGYWQIQEARDNALAEAVRATTAEEEAKKQQKAAEGAAAAEKTERGRADAAKEETRRALYDVEMSLLQPAWDADNLARFDQLLSRQRPAPGESDLRTFEWHYWNRLRHAGLPGVKLVAEARLGETLAANPVLSPDGTRVAAHTGLLLLRLPDPASGGEAGQLQFTADGTRLLLVRTYPSLPGADGWRALWDATPLPAR
jgi:hypothetical protein